MMMEVVKKICSSVSESRWMNERAKNNTAYVPTMKEHCANILTHGVSQSSPIINTNTLASDHCSSLSLAQLSDDLQCQGSNSAVLQSGVWSSSHWSLLSINNLPHSGCHQQPWVMMLLMYIIIRSWCRMWKELLHRSDRAMIYLFIAGSYTPWLQLRHLSGVSVELRLVSRWSSGWF